MNNTEIEEIKEQIIKPKLNAKDELISNIKEWIKIDNEIKLRIFFSQFDGYGKIRQ